MSTEPVHARRMTSSSTMFERALERLAATGPEFCGGLSNHAPMAVEALHHLGRDEVIPEWLEAYAHKLEPAPQPSGEPPRLGSIASEADWARLFERELAEHDWRRVVQRWVPQLAPGVFAAATHGLLRTAHAIRSLREADTPLRRRELAEGLAYWAASYQTLPGIVRARGQRSAAELLATLPAISRSESFLITDGIHDIDRVPELALHLSELDPAELEPGRLLAAFALWAGAGASVSAIVHVHVLTSTVALLQLEDLLDPLDLRDLLTHAWHAGAALIATWRPASPLPGDPQPPDREALITRAIACADEHGIKLVDACLTAFDRFAEPSLLHAADTLLRAIERHA